MITINTQEASNTLATDIILALNELQSRVEAQGTDQFMVESQLSDPTRVAAICWHNGALHAVDTGPYVELKAPEGAVVIAGLDSRKRITPPNMELYRHGSIAVEFSRLREFWEQALSDEKPDSVASLIAFGRLPASTRQVLKVDTNRLLWDVTNRDILEDERSEDFLDLVEDALLELFQPLLTNELTDGEVYTLTQEIWDRFKLFAHELDHLVEWLAERHSISADLQRAHDRLVKALG